LDKTLKLGNLDAQRDWGHAGEYVEAMWCMLQQDEPEDYVIATGEAHTVREFADVAFRCVGLDYRDFLEIDKNLYRPSEVHILQGDASKAKSNLRWSPRVTFEQLIGEMVEADLKWYQRV
jgi:GDPmannose 4,6-dehydratase